MSEHDSRRMLGRGADEIGGGDDVAVLDRSGRVEAFGTLVDVLGETATVDIGGGRCERPFALIAHPDSPATEAALLATEGDGEGVPEMNEGGSCNVRMGGAVIGNVMKVDDGWVAHAYPTLPAEDYTIPGLELTSLDEGVAAVIEEWRRGWRR